MQFISKVSFQPSEMSEMLALKEVYNTVQRVQRETHIQETILQYYCVYSSVCLPVTFPSGRVSSVDKL